MKSNGSNPSLLMLPSGVEDGACIAGECQQDDPDHTENLLLAEIVRARSGGETVSVDIDDLISETKAGIHEKSERGGHVATTAFAERFSVRM